MTKREQFIQWLGDAHAMEVGIVSTLEKHAADAKGLPEVRASILKHLKETKRHASDIKKVLQSLGAGHPYVREGISKVTNLVAGVATSLANDTPVKNGIADFATEHFEIACYNSLIFTATELGEKKIVATCRSILKDEIAMAKTLERQFKRVNAFYLSQLEDEKSDVAVTPKRVSRDPGSRSKAAGKKKSC